MDLILVQMIPPLYIFVTYMTSEGSLTPERLKLADSKRGESLDNCKMVSVWSQIFWISRSVLHSLELHYTLRFCSSCASLLNCSWLSFCLIQVHPDDVIGPPIPGPIVLIVDCPTEPHAQELLSAQALNAYYSDSQSNSQETTKVVNCIIHLSPATVVSSPVYEKWMRKFGSAQHIMARTTRSVTSLHDYFRFLHINTGS